MPDENSPGASYLASLKQSSGGQAPAHNGAPHDPSTSLLYGATSILASSAKSVAPEKRRSPRYRCQGSAHLREISSGSATWATFTDISLHGIYVEAMSTYRVGARIALTLEINGFRVETSAEVRVVYPSLGMGICFIAMVAEDRERLRLLLRSLSQPSVILHPHAAPQPSMVTAADSSSISDPAAALHAIVNFFDQRHILSRDEFLRIIKKSQAES